MNTGFVTAYKNAVAKNREQIAEKERVAPYEMKLAGRLYGWGMFAIVGVGLLICALVWSGMVPTDMGSAAVTLIFGAFLGALLSVLWVIDHKVREARRELH